MEKITNSFLENSYVYMPYLGKNDHYANIIDAQIVELKQITNSEKVNSLFIRDYFEFKKDKKNISNLDFQQDDMWKYEERLPIELGKEENQYITVPFIFTNMNVLPKAGNKLFTESEKTLFFF